MGLVARTIFATTAALSATHSAAVPVAGQGSWETTVQARDLDADGQPDAFYDTVLNITWLRDLRQYDHMQWANAKSWVGALSFGGYTGWRLPRMLDTGAGGCDLSYAGGTDCGYNVQTAEGGVVYSEIAHLYYVTLGNRATCTPGDAVCGVPQPGHGLTNVGGFFGLREEVYWFETGYGQSAPFYAWMFSMYGGYQNDYSTDRFAFAMAVRDGDVGSPVPVPGTVWLALAAVGGALGGRRAWRRASTPGIEEISGSHCG